MGYQGFVIKRDIIRLGLRQKGRPFEIYFRYCLLTKSEDDPGANFRIEPTCIIIILEKGDLFVKPVGFPVYQNRV